MKVVILCGGKARMADANYDAKALVDIGGRPSSVHIMKIYVAYGLQTLSSRSTRSRSDKAVLSRLRANDPRFYPLSRRTA
jgi:molybdopterin-guanine dinucleotide biosynthesis protein A